jgi:pimeloyl-ACP methyl ester carboxylesterase
MSDTKVDPQLHTGKAEVNGASLYYEQRGEGPSLLFIPGGSVDAWHYAAVAEILARDFRVVTYDRRGNGRSPRPPTCHATDIAEQADDAAGLIEALGLAPCAVWAGSLGGVILLELLARRPGLVRVAMVQEPPLFGALADGDGLARGLVASAASAVRRRRVTEGFLEHVHQSVGSSFDTLAAESKSRMVANAEVFLDFEIPALADYRHGLTGALAAMPEDHLPFTVMADPQNRGTPPFRAAATLAERLGTTLRDLPGGHMPYATDPENTAAAIRSQLDEVDTERRTAWRSDGAD